MYELFASVNSTLRDVGCQCRNRWNLTPARLTGMMTVFRDTLSRLRDKMRGHLHLFCQTRLRSRLEFGFHARNLSNPNHVRAVSFANRFILTVEEKRVIWLRVIYKPPYAF